MRHTPIRPLLVLFALAASACGGKSAPVAAPEPSAAVIRSVSDVEWGPLNPARGDASPRAADLWGDRTTEGASGFLVRFRDGFASPPHVHNVTYRAVVLSGRVHNDDPSAEERWMGPGSFWTQPAGAPHITAARGEDVVAYVEIDRGPYLVHPVADAFSVAEQAVNLPAAAIEWSNDEPSVALLWGDPRAEAGRFVRLAPGTAASLRARDPFNLVTVVGHSTVNDHRLEPGGSVEATDLELRCESDASCSFYVRSSGTLEVLH